LNPADQSLSFPADSRKKAIPSDNLTIRTEANKFSWESYMSKREIIDYILEINKSAKPEFLAQFSKEDLDLYLEHLMEIDLEEVALCA
jgi:hypothetical protein